MTTDTYRPVTVGNWMLTMFLMGITLINIILLFVWAFGSNTEVSKANWAKATLLWFVIGVILSIIWVVVLGAGFFMLTPKGGTA